LLAVVAQWLVPSLHFVDQVAAILVATLLLGAAWQIASPSLRELVEANQDPKLAVRVAELAREFPEIRSIHRVRCRRVGGAMFVDLHMWLDPATPVIVAHDTSHRFQAAVRSDQPGVMEVIAHIEPARSQQESERQTEDPILPTW
jgi:divalent metal cation (Fe/Co/Zn/Cd) transporter